METEPMSLHSVLATVRVIEDICSVTTDRVAVLYREVPAGSSLEDLDLQGFCLGTSGMTIVNDVLIEPAEAARYRPQRGDDILLVRLPAGIGAAIGLGAIGAAIFDFLALTVVNLAVGFAISALTASAAKRNAAAIGSQREEDTPTRSFFSQSNTVGEGVPINLVYGRHRVFGHVVQSFQEPRFDVTDSTDSNVTTTAQDPLDEQDAVYLHGLTGLCWGPIRSVTDIRIDDNPIENIAGVQVETSLGTPYQKPPTGFNTAKVARQIGQEVTNAAAVTIQTTTTPDSFQIGLLFPSGLFGIDDQGNLEDRSVSIEVQIRRVGAPLFDVYASRTISGATRSPKAYWIDGPQLAGDVDYDIQVVRTSADTPGTDLNTFDEFRWETLNEVESGGQNYAGIAWVSLRNQPGEQSRVYQSVSAVVEGAADIRVYTSEAEYTVGYTTNPAWCCAHWLTHPLHGPGRYFSFEDIDIPSFLEWAAWCDERIPNDSGGTGPRAELNVIINTRTNGQDLLEVFGAGSATSIVQVGGKWRAVVDRPKPVVKHFNAANIVAGTISVADVPASQRASRITGSFNNSENDWEVTPYPLEADGLAPSDGFVDESKRLLGTTKPYQAAWILNRDILQNQYQLRRAEFEATIGAIALQVGDIFGLSHPDVGTAVATGHVLGVSASQRTIHVDDDLELDPNESYFVVIEHQADQHIEQKALTGVSGAPTHLVQVASDWEYTLREGDRYSILSTPLELYRCIALDTADNLNRKVVGVLYDERAYIDEVPNMTPDEPRGGQPLGLFPSAVPDLVLRFPVAAAGDGGAEHCDSEHDRCRVGRADGGDRRAL